MVSLSTSRDVVAGGGVGRAVEGRGAPPFADRLLQALDLGGVEIDDVLRLARVVLQVEERPGPGLAADPVLLQLVGRELQDEASVAHDPDPAAVGGGARLGETQDAGRRLRSRGVGDPRPEALPLLPAAFGEIHAGGREKRRSEVEQLHRSLVHRRLQPARPVQDERHVQAGLEAEAAVVEVVAVLAQRLAVVRREGGQGVVEELLLVPSRRAGGRSPGRRRRSRRRSARHRTPAACRR